MGIKRITDKDGNPIRMVCCTPTNSQVKESVKNLIDNGEIKFGNNAFSTGEYVLSNANFKANAMTSVNLITSDLAKNDFYAIPIFGIADTHSSLPTKKTGCFDLGEYITSISPESVMGLFLGDICDICYSTSVLDNYKHNVDAFSKSISVIGNHDRNNVKSDGVIVDITNSELNKYFSTQNFERFSDVLYGSYTDIDFNVKYIVLNPYENVPCNNLDVPDKVRIGTKQMTWLIKNLTECDRDIIILMHQLFIGNHIHRDGTEMTWDDSITVFHDIWKMLKDRKNNRKGTIIDSDNISHNYDFTNCTSDLLCTIHGHAHEELYLQDEGLLSYVLDYGHDKNCVFMSINRAENKLKISQFNSNEVKTTLELGLKNKNSIINNLTNVTSSNMATTGVDTNSSYTTTLTATSGTLGTITVKMNDTDISSTAVNENVVTIDSVVGRVEITATAK